MHQSAQSNPLTPQTQLSVDVQEQPIEIPEVVPPQRTFLIASDPVSSSSAFCSPSSLQEQIPPLTLTPQQQQQQYQQESLPSQEKIIPVIIDVTNQIHPPKLGLHGSLQPNAFLSYAADLVGLPPASPKSPYPIDRSPTLNYTPANVLPPPVSRSTPFNNVDLDVP